VKRPVLLTALVAASLVAVGPAQAEATSKRNPFGVTVVRFASGTGAAEMEAAVSKAGGDVVTDLSEVAAVAAAPIAPDFTARIGANPRVTSVFPEPVFRMPVGRDVDGTAAPPWSPVFGDSASPDPWHDASSFLGVSNPQGMLQWDDARMNVRPAWRRTLGDRTARVAVLDTGVQGAHRELQANFVGARNFIPCDTLARDFGVEVVKQFGLRDCSNGDREGHGTWVASRIAGALNGFASNGVAPRVQVASYKVLAAGFGGMPDWILSGLVAACRDRVDLVNMSITGYLDPSDPADAETFLLFNDVVEYCLGRGVTIFAAAGNEHVRVDRVTMTLDGRTLSGVGRVSPGLDGIATVFPGRASIEDSDLRGALEAPAGVPGVIMVSATNNANEEAPDGDPFGEGMHAGVRDQLAYYSSYGSRVDVSAPGGARRFNLPGWDGGDGNFLYGGYGSLAALDASGMICGDAIQSSLFNFACFKVDGNGFGWLQGTSVAAPNAVGVAALTISARPGLRGDPVALVARLRATATRDLTNYTGPTDPANRAPTYDGRPCTTGFCHLDTTRSIDFADAYGAGLVNAAAAVG
jgi:lantibiotic leader peptide-processing serine protease